MEESAGREQRLRVLIEVGVSREDRLELESDELGQEGGQILGIIEILDFFF